MAKVVHVPARPANDDTFRAPPFDPNNPDHVRAWEATFEVGMAALRAERRKIEEGE
jgi:hypothetical protein